MDNISCSPILNVYKFISHVKVAGFQKTISGWTASSAPEHAVLVDTSVILLEDSDEIMIVKVVCIEHIRFYC